LNQNYRFPAEQIPVYKKEWRVRIIDGPQIDYFTDQGIETFLSGEYEITPQSNRMGYRLKGPEIEHKTGADIITDATPPGSVQVPGNGMPIVLLADAQSTGGYSKIGAVISQDQDLLAQAKPGEKIKFQRIDFAESQNLYRESEEKIQKIKREALVSR
jgi:antagonist of KipI